MSDIWSIPFSSIEGSLINKMDWIDHSYGQFLLEKIAGHISHMLCMYAIFFLILLCQTTHVEQQKGRSLLCSLLCSLRCTNCVNLAEQRSHAYGFVPECSRMCVFRFDVELNRFWHSWH